MLMKAADAIEILMDFMCSFSEVPWACFESDLSISLYSMMLLWFLLFKIGRLAPCQTGFLFVLVGCGFDQWRDEYGHQHSLGCAPHSSPGQVRGLFYFLQCSILLMNCSLPIEKKERLTHL